MAESFLVNARQFKFELVAPEKIESSEMEERVVLPGEMGDFHGSGWTYAIAGGFCVQGVISVMRLNNQSDPLFHYGRFCRM